MPHAESSEMLLGFRQVAAYREILNHIRKSANGTLVWGCIIGALWIMAFNQINLPFHKLPLFMYFHLLLAVSELTVGLWKKIAPSPFTFLLDALLLVGFAAVNGWRAYLQFKVNGSPNLFTAGICIYMCYLAYQQFQAWIQINRALIYRPTRTQLAQFNSLVKDVRKADPEADPNALDLRTRPGWRALLLGDIAFFVASTGTVVVAHKDEVDLESTRSDDSKHAMLWLPGGQFGPFPLDPRNAANYLNWKANR
jgi:hypothetical protein